MYYIRFGKPVKTQPEIRKERQKDAQPIEFPVTVGPDGTQTVSYTVEYTW